MGYAAAGLARGISGGLGMVSNALMGIEQRKIEEQERARQAEADAQRAQLLGLQIRGAERDLNAPPPVARPFKVSVDGVTGEFATPEEALGFRGQVPQAPGRLKGPGDRMFEDTPEGRAALLAWRQQYDPQEAPKPRERRTSFDKFGNLVDMDTGDVIRPAAAAPAGPGGSGVAGMDDLPVTTQAAVTGAAPALEALDRYRTAAEEYLKRGGGNRLLGAVGVSGGAQDRSIGALNSMKQALLLHIKQAADLGALNGPDQQIVLEMIGDPTGLGAVRNPERVLAGIDEARRFLESKIAGIEGAYGVNVPRPAAPPAPSALPDDIEAATAATLRRLGR